MTRRLAGRRVASFATAFGLALAAGAGTAHADPPAPTDFLSRVVSIDPPVAGLAADVVGGDSFFRLTLAASVTVEVVVLGYQEEPYLRFLPGGAVEENERSPTTYLSASKYAMSTPPPEADADAPPVWRRIASDGSWSWHDHRTHWMTTVPPPDASRGDQILASSIELRVDGAPVTITVTSTWMAAPSSAPPLIGAIAGGVLGLLAMRRSGAHRVWWPAIVIALAAVGASMVGLWQTWSLPDETGPPLAAWAIPVTVGIVALVAAIAIARRWSRFTLLGVVLVAAVQLLVWSAQRRDVIDHAILPTNAPFWLDRAITAGAAGLAAVMGAFALASVVRVLLAPPPDQPSASM
jgi:hypothetical protein